MSPTQTLSAPRSPGTWAVGLFAGLLGYATVVVFFAIENAVAGRSVFYTAALLGSALFFGLRDPAALQITPAAVLTYNMVHVVAFIGLGLLVSWLVTMAERHPAMRYVTLVALLFVVAHVYAALLLFAQPFLPAASWQIGLATLGAAAVMGAYLMAVHPRLRAGLTALPMGDE